MNTQTPRSILVAPLDWGLGHTTRCIPIIRYLLHKGHKVTLAGNERQRSYITATLPGIRTTHLDGYNVTYSRGNFAAALLLQLPGILRKINKEHTWLAEQQGYDLIISDNRYGLHRSDIPCIIITHQLSIQTGKGAVADTLLRKLHYRYLERFIETWIVDAPGTHNLAGKLSHPSVLPKGGKYIGLLSQLAAPDGGHSPGKHLLVLLSGPEPQRSILASMLWAQVVKSTNCHIVFVAGDNDAAIPDTIPAHISYHKKISGNLLRSLIADAAIVICRSGYSTIMDLVRLHKKAILIPTPGQTEQEYLGAYLHAQGLYYSTPQKGFSLTDALAEAALFPFNDLTADDQFHAFEPIIDLALT